MQSQLLPDSLKALSGRDVDGWRFLEEGDVRRRATSRQHMIPLAVQYAGLGLYRVLEYVPEKDGFFIHIDGGSNDYDRADHAACWNAYKPNDQEVNAGPVAEVIRDDAESGHEEAR